MKYIYNILIVFLLIGFASCSSSRYYQSNPDEYSQDDETSITYNQFYNDLSPYGNWVNYPNYGYVWIPYLSNFRPYYTNGHWVYTNYGWTWASNYSWGWAPFHYGRWMMDPYYGWMWIPGTEWAPAWVTWRGGGDYYGWAPLGPGMYPGNYGSIPYDYWTFVPGRYISSPRIYNYYVNQSRNTTIINHTTIIRNTNYQGRNANNESYNPGPPVREIENSTGRQIRRYNVVRSDKPQATEINNNSVRVFRPTVQQSENARPERVTDLNDARIQNNQRNNNQAAPVREFPKDQAPQINRNEPSVNNRPQVIPDKNNAPSRAFPTENNQPPVQRNPDANKENQPNRNIQPTPPPAQNQNMNRPPVRTFPKRDNNQPPRDPDPVMQTPSNNRSATPPAESELRSNPPARSFSNRQERNSASVPVPNNNTSQRNVRQIAPANPSTQSTPTRSLNVERKPVVREKKEIREVRPAQTVREVQERKKDE